MVIQTDKKVLSHPLAQILYLTQKLDMGMALRNKIMNSQKTYSCNDGETDTQRQVLIG